MRRLIYLLPVLLFLTLGGYFLLALRPSYDPHRVPSALLDQEAPPFALPGLKAEGVARDALKGTPAVINFFASWCVPCRIEHPFLMRLAGTGKTPIYGIDYKDKAADALRLLAQYGNPYRAIGQDSEGRTGLDFGITGVPETYVLDRDGIVRRRWVGPLTEDQLENELLPLLRSLGAS